MDADTLRIVLIGALASALALWVLSTFLFRMAGTWERELTEEDERDGTRAERITLAQLGPFVTGRRDVKGGYQEFSGLAFGRGITLNRRDHGRASLLALGFPEAVAQKLDGEVMARLKLTLHDGIILDGLFEPQKVEFTHQPPRVTGMHFLPGQR
ncbi:MAG TPA: hypothetical protein VGO62_00695, partial [Myxococcota bacterium]